MRNLPVRFARFVALIVLLLAVPSLANGAGAVASSAACMVAVTPLAFGTYDPLRHNTVASVGLLRYRCFGTHSRLIIGLTAGQFGSFRARSMVRGRDAIKYNLYLDASGTQVWGDGTGGTQTYIVNSPPSESDVSVPIYGRLFGNQNGSAGNYRDNVSVIVGF